MDEVTKKRVWEVHQETEDGRPALIHKGKRVYTVVMDTTDFRLAMIYVYHNVVGEVRPAVKDIGQRTLLRKNNEALPFTKDSMIHYVQDREMRANVNDREAGVRPNRRIVILNSLT